MFDILNICSRFTSLYSMSRELRFFNYGSALLSPFTSGDDIQLSYSVTCIDTFPKHQIKHRIRWWSCNITMFWCTCPHLGLVMTCGVCCNTRWTRTHICLVYPIHKSRFLNRTPTFLWCNIIYCLCRHKAFILHICITLIFLSTFLFPLQNVCINVYLCIGGELQSSVTMWWCNVDLSDCFSFITCDDHISVAAVTCNRSLTTLECRTTSL